MSIMVKNYKGKVCNMYQDEYKRWLAADLEDADLKPELAKVEGNDDEIKDRFAVALKFGTAGLRGVLGAGTNRMNRYNVRRATKGPQVLISRTHPGLVKRLFELEVPEIFDGTVEVKAISREAGARTKMAVWSKDPNVNPVSACIGEHGARVAAVVEKLGGEKIDIVKWSEDISEFISAALSPAKVVKVELLPGETRSCRVTVPDQQLSLAIGNKGQNARLCARLTGYNIDIRPESGYYGEDEEPKKDATDAE